MIHLSSHEKNGVRYGMGTACAFRVSSLEPPTTDFREKLKPKPGIHNQNHTGYRDVYRITLKIVRACHGPTLVGRPGVEPARPIKI